MKKVCAGCILLPILLFASCAAKMNYDHARYELPGRVLQSSAQPTRALGTPMQVAEALDAYVQPRFEILRDKNFGALRIVFRKHAGIVQLKVDTSQEKEAIANVNGAHRDYAIGLLHCAPIPDRSGTVTPKLQLLYFNQKALAGAATYEMGGGREIAAKNELDLEGFQEEAVKALPRLMAGKEHRTGDDTWTVLMRPVRASTQECLSCHTNAQAGATLGVMVYAVRKTLNTAPAKIGMR
jgi:hypothetical protein